nr:uncharacterized protein LOC127303469 [Lolium perenne]
MPMDWEWGFLPLSSTNPPTDEACERFPCIATEARGSCQKRAVDKVDPDPYVPWKELKMGRTHTPRPDAPSVSANPQVVEHAAPLQAEVGQDFLDKLASRGQKHKAPAPEAGSSHAPPAKRPKKPSVKHYRKREMPVASGPALKLSKSATGMLPESSEDGPRASPPPQASPVPSGTGKTPASPAGGNISVGCAAPKSTDHRTEEVLSSPPEVEDTGASNTSAGKEPAEQAEPPVPSVPKKKKKKTTASPAKTVPETSAPATSSPAKEAPEAPAPPKDAPAPPPEAPAGQPAAAKPTPPEGTKLSAQQLAASLVLHAGRAALAAGETASSQLGRITELSRGGADLGHLLEYAEKWNQADLSPASLGLGKDKLPVVDPAGPQSTGQFFGRLRRVVKEFDIAWHDANNNVVSVLDTRKWLFEELLWEHGYLSEAHSKCQALPEASFEDLTAQLSALKAEKEQLVQEHRQALDAEKTNSRELKDQLVQAELRHDRELKEAKAAAEAKLNEFLEESTNSSAVLRAELEEESKARKEAEARIATMTTYQAHYDQLVMQADALAFQLFPDSQPHALKKFAERMAEHAMSNPNAPLDAYDHLVMLTARIQHMSLRGGAPTDIDPAKTAKRKDRAYRIAQSAPTRTFIPPPVDLHDDISEGEEEEGVGEDEEEVPADDAALDQASEAPAA